MNYLVVSMGAVIGSLLVFLIIYGISVLKKKLFKSEETFEAKLNRILNNSWGIIEIKSFNKFKPFKVKNGRQAIKQHIKTKLFKKINDQLIDDMVLNDNRSSVVCLNQNMVADYPMAYREPFNLLFNESVAEISVEYEKMGYIVSVDLQSKEWYIKISLNP